MVVWYPLSWVNYAFFKYDSIVFESMNGCMSNECDLTRLQSITLSEGTLQGNDERSESNVDNEE